MSDVDWLLDIDGVINRASWTVPEGAFETWIEHRVTDLSTGRSFRIRMAAEVIEFINEVHASRKANIIWHTTWQRSANEVAKAFGLPHNLPILDAPEFERWDHQNAHGWWKMQAGVRNITAAVEAGRRVIWTDDDLDFSHLRELRVDFDMAELMVIAPDSAVGLTQEHLDAMWAFLEEGELR